MSIQEGGVKVQRQLVVTALEPSFGLQELLPFGALRPEGAGYQKQEKRNKKSLHTAKIYQRLPIFNIYRFEGSKAWGG